MPLYNVAAHLLMPRARCRRYISDDLAPVTSEADMLVMGVDTTCSPTIKGGPDPPRRRRAVPAR
jgi:hypothetical protein